MRFPCREVVCQEVPGSNSSGGLPDWGIALIIMVVVAVFGGLAFYFLKKKVQNSIEVSLGFVLAAALRIQPRTRTPNDVDVESSMVSEVHGSSSVYPTLPTYNEAINT